MRFLSVCSGIGCADLAFTRLGWEAAAMSEIEAFPRAVLAHRFPGIPVHGDFTTIQGDTYGPVDLLVGGTPCQSFSVAGLRGGMADARGNLALEYLRLADRLRAKWLVWENVPGVLSSAGGRDFGAFLGGLGELGYGFAYRVLDAQHFGVAQRRRRVFVVGYLGDWRRAAAVLFEPASLRGHPAPRREKGQGTPVGALAGTSPGGGWRVGADEAAAGQIVADTLTRGANQYSGFNGEPVVARCLTAHPSRSDGETENFVTHTLRGEGFDAGEGGTGRGTPLVPISFSAEMSEPSWAVDLSETLKTTCPPAITGAAVRRLTPRECERLQGLPDDHTLIPYGRGVSADGPRYKAIGNGMAVPCLEWIGRRIAMVDAQRALEVAA